MHLRPCHSCHRRVGPAVQQLLRCRWWHGSQLMAALMVLLLMMLVMMVMTVGVLLGLRRMWLGAAAS